MPTASSTCKGGAGNAKAPNHNRNMDMGKSELRRHPQNEVKVEDVSSSYDFQTVHVFPMLKFLANILLTFSNTRLPEGSNT